MADETTHLYEGMFLFNSAAIDSSVAAATQAVRDLLDRADAQIEALYKWDDRKLTYPIEGQKRGLYMLAYFKVRGVQIANIERDVNLSEPIMRCLIIRADHVGETELQLAVDKQQETADAASLEKGSEEESSEEAPQPAAEAAPDTAEAGREESMAAASADPDAARPTPSEGEDSGDAPESGTKAE